ncbi:hypothetical protein, partial [Flavobacterium hydatis]
MRNFKTLMIVFLIIVFNSCDNKVQKKKTSEALETKIIDSLILLKDTIVFFNSSEGEKLSLFKNQKTKDSIIKSTIYGETGKIDYTFIFNKELFNANRVSSNYEEPIYINSNPKINKITDENLKTSALVKEELTNIFIEDIKFFRSQKLHTRFNKIDLILKKWEGIYYLSPYPINSEELGNYYIDIFKDYLDFGFSGNNDFKI